MQKKTVRILLLAFVVMATSLLAYAQAPTPHVIQPGDTVYDLRGLYDCGGPEMRTLVALNPFLRGPGRVFIQNDRCIVIVKPGEILDATGPAVNPLPISSLKLPSGTPEVRTEVVTQTPSWLWWLLAFFAMALAGLWLMSRNPTTWRPMVEGGLTDETVTTHFTEQATRRGATLVPGSQQRVRLSGVWGTQHRGIGVGIPHHYRQERAWRARFRMPNGTEVPGYMLQGCGNDVTYGGAWYTPQLGATVEEGWGDEVVTAQPTVAPLPVVMVTETPSTPNTTPATQPEVEDGLTRIELRRATNDHPAMLRMTGVDEKGDATLELKEGVVVIRFTPR